MPLTCIRPVYPLGYKGNTYISLSSQIYNHIKSLYTPRTLKNNFHEYHDIFSKPHLWFSLGIMDVETFKKIINEYPNSIDKNSDYFIDFCFKNYMWHDIPSTSLYTPERWRFIQYPLDMCNKHMITFINEWVRTMDNPDEKFRELFYEWKRQKWTSIFNKKSMITVVSSFGNIGRKYALQFRNDFDEEEKKSRFIEDEDIIPVKRSMAVDINKIFDKIKKDYDNESLYEDCLSDYDSDEELDDYESDEKRDCLSSSSLF